MRTMPTEDRHYPRGKRWRNMTEDEEENLVRAAHAAAVAYTSDLDKLVARALQLRVDAIALVAHKLDEGEGTGEGAMNDWYPDAAKIVDGKIGA